VQANIGRRRRLKDGELPYGKSLFLRHCTSTWSPGCSSSRQSDWCRSCAGVSRGGARNLSHCTPSSTTIDRRPCGGYLPQHIHTYQLQWKCYRSFIYKSGGKTFLRFHLTCIKMQVKKSFNYGRVPGTEGVRVAVIAQFRVIARQHKAHMPILLQKKSIRSKSTIFSKTLQLL
jgi:hypothetical protein